MTQDIPPPRSSNSSKRKVLRFGDLVAGAYERCGKARANGVLRLAVNANLVVFSGQRRFMIVTE